MEPVLAGREWLAGAFSVTDILMADVLRMVDRLEGLKQHPVAPMSRAPRRAGLSRRRARTGWAHFAAADAQHRLQKPTVA
jgi:glutathione S-transferase